MKISKMIGHTAAITVDYSPEAICTHDWSPSVYRNGYRNANNFEYCSILGLDVDAGLSIEAAKSILAGFDAIVAPTRNHQVPKNGITCDRFRIILKLSEPITTKEDYAATWHSAQKLLPSIDAAAKDCSRLFFKSTSYEHTGGTLAFPVVKAAAAKVARVELPATVKHGIPHTVTRFLEDGPLEGLGFNQSLFKSSKLLQQQGHDVDEVIEIFETMSNSHYIGALDANDLKTIRSAFAVAPKYGPTIMWPDMLKTRGGDVSVNPRSQENFVYFLESIMKAPFAYNELKNEIELDGRAFDDTALSKIRFEARKYGLTPGEDLIIDVIRMRAMDNAYHPLKVLIESTPYDGHDHISDLFKSITVDGDENPMYATYLRRWLIGAIARVYQPGSYNNVLVFVGGQGLGKSRWFEKFSLCPGCYHEGALDPSSKDDKLKAATTIFWSISELDHVTRKKDAGAIKAFITDTSFTIRAPYDRYAKQLTAVVSFAASVNETSFLVDKTGNRRFLNIPVKALNVDHGVDLRQVLAQAHSLFLAGEKWWFEADDIVKVNELNEDFMCDTRLDFLSMKVASGPDLMNIDEILTHLGYKDARNSGDYVIFGKVLTSRGINSVRKQMSNKRLNYYLVDKASLNALM